MYRDNEYSRGSILLRGRKLNFDLFSTFLSNLDRKLFVGNAHKCSIEDWFHEAWRSEGGTVLVGVKVYLSLHSEFVM